LNELIQHFEELIVLALTADCEFDDLYDICELAHFTSVYEWFNNLFINIFGYISFELIDIYQSLNTQG
jgi:hypothetical protein